MRQLIKYMNSFGQNLLLSIILALVLIIPDISFSFIEPSFFVYSTKLLKAFLGLVVLSFLIVSLRKLTSKLLIFMLFTVLSLLQMMHFLFFHGPLMHYEITMFFSQFSEVWESFEGVVQYIWLPLVFWFIQVLLGYYLLKKSNGYGLSFKYSGLILLVVILAFPYSAYKRHNISSMMPTNRVFSIINLTNSIALFIGKELPKHVFSSEKNTQNYKAYKVVESRLDNLPQNIIVVMGESLGYRHMHLFGGEFQNTPYLDALKQDSNFLYKKAYSAGIDTLTVVPSFFQLKREPRNISILAKKDTNLLSMAKEHGYRTYYLTTQKLNIMASYSFGADIVKQIKGKDELLIEELEKIDFSKKNFIVLHQRNSHSPYESNVPASFYKFPFENKDFQTYMFNSYNNSILYTDYLLGRLIDKIKMVTNSVLFMTPDHAEMMGLNDENGRYGHAILNKQVARVPVLIFTNKIKIDLIGSYKKFSCSNHYNFGKTIAKSLGYEVINLNEDGSYFIQGISIDGSSGFLKYSEAECL